MLRKVQRNAATGRTWMAYLKAAGMEVSCQSPRCPPGDALWPAVVAQKQQWLVFEEHKQTKNHMVSAGSELRILHRRVFQLLFMSQSLRQKVLLQAPQDNSSKNGTQFSSEKRLDQPRTPITLSKRQPAMNQGFQEKIHFVIWFWSHPPHSGIQSNL